jgi:hypothetical protein
MGLMSVFFMQLLPFSGLLPALLFRFYSSDLMLRPNPMQSNHAMERTPDRRMTRLKEELRIMKYPTHAPVRRRSSCSR